MEDHRTLHLGRRYAPHERLQRRVYVLHEPAEGLGLVCHPQAVGHGEHRRLRDARERLHDTDPRSGHGLEDGDATRVQGLVELRAREHVGQIALVVREDQRNLFRVQPVGLEVLREVRETLLVRLGERLLRVRHEHDPVAPREHRASRRVVLDLARHGVELEGQAIAPDAAEVEPQKVKEERPVGRGVEGVELGAPLRVSDPVEVLQTRGLPAQAGAVVHHLQLHLPVLVVKLNHRPLAPRPAVLLRTGRRSPAWARPR